MYYHCSDADLFAIDPAIYSRAASIGSQSLPSTVME